MTTDSKDESVHGFESAETLAGSELTPVSSDILDWESITAPDQEMRRESAMLDIDRMVNEGMGGGYVTEDNARIGQTTTDTMKTVDEKPQDTKKGSR